MPRITKPMLAGKFDPEKAVFPYDVTPKIDGIRFLIVNGTAVSRNFKPIPNKHIRSTLSVLPEGVDGEIVSGKNFQETTSAVMTIEGTPEFNIYIFDYVRPDLLSTLPYCQRMQDLLLALNLKTHENVDGLLWPTRINSMEELLEFEEKVIEDGYEGVILRDPMGPYKFGRSTTKENILLKLKRFVDNEGELIRIERKMSNQNPEEYDAFGNVKRSSSMDGMIPLDEAGALVVRLKSGQELSIGSGLDDILRKEIWSNPGKYLGKLVKFKYFPHGVKDLPRHPVFLGFRDPDDL
jgi:DNA ligase-1